MSQLLRKVEERAVEVDGIDGKEQLTSWIDEDFSDSEKSHSPVTRGGIILGTPHKVYSLLRDNATD